MELAAIKAKLAATEAGRLPEKARADAAVAAEASKAALFSRFATAKVQP